MNLTNLSRYLSLILRHKPEAIDITLDEHGWANVHDLIDGIAKNNPGFDMMYWKKLCVQTINSVTLSIPARH